ncbi:THAP domain-containing protein 3-like [Rhopilema esculentum]|uniref:THAP domain-containing protein 3-like n=1 Tax=Rhopilema esculentum TaxID=499914 RepID=UPI0031DB2930
MHRFPSKNLDLRRQWIRFVRRHHANFNHQAYSIGPYLCSDHFERSCYEKPFALELPGFDSSKTKRTLKKDGIPTVFNTRGQSQAFSESSSKVARNRRTLLRGIKQHEHANRNECASGQFNEEIEEVEVGENAFTIGDSFTIGEQHNDSEEHVDVVPLQCQVHLTGAPVHTCPTCITPQPEEVQGNIRTHTAIQVAMMCKK